MIKHKKIDSLKFDEIIFGIKNYIIYDRKVSYIVMSDIIFEIIHKYCDNLDTYDNNLENLYKKRYTIFGVSMTYDNRLNNEIIFGYNENETSNYIKILKRKEKLKKITR